MKKKLKPNHLARAPEHPRTKTVAPTTAMKEGPSPTTGGIRMREAELPRAWIPKIGIPQGGIAYKSRRWCVFKAAMAWGALGAAVIASAVYYLAPEYGFLMIVPLEVTGVYTGALFADLALRRREEKRMPSRSIPDQREREKKELEEDLAILRGLGLPTEQLAEEQLRIIREFRRRRSRLLARQIDQQELRQVIGEPVHEDTGGKRAAPNGRLSRRGSAGATPRQGSSASS